MATLQMLIFDETTEVAPRRFVTLWILGNDGTVRFVGPDNNPSDNWSGRWVSLAAVPSETGLWNVQIPGVPPGKYFIQFRMVEDRVARPAYQSGGYAPPESVEVRVSPQPFVAVVHGHAKDLAET